MTGNIADAFLALTEHDDPYTSLYYIGEGNTRVAYLINGIVYKVDIDAGSNEREYDRATFLRTAGIPEGYAIPDMRLFSIDGYDVLAMEYINGMATGDCIDILCSLPCEHAPGECLPPDALEYLNEISYDSAYGNIIRADDVLYLIDCA